MGRITNLRHRQLVQLLVPFATEMPVLLVLHPPFDKLPIGWKRHYRRAKIGRVTVHRSDLPVSAP